jgi:hypothetical protein
MNGTTETVRSSRLVLGEGKDEERFIGWLLSKLRQTDSQVLSYGGKSRLREFVKGLISSRGFERVQRLVITRDADQSPDSAFQSVCDALKGAALPCPSSPDTLSDAGARGLRVGVLILPGEGRTGALEDLCFDVVGSDSAVGCVETFLSCLGERGVALQESRLGKARMQVWLASREQPGLRLGEAAEAGYIPADSPAFASLLRLLQME